MKGGAFLPLFIAALTPLLLLGLLVYGSTLGAVAWRPPLLWTDQFGNPSLSSGVTGVAAVNGTVYVNGILDYNVSSGVPFLREYRSDGSIAWTSQVENFTATAGLSVGSNGIYILGGTVRTATLRSYDFNGNQLWSRILEPGIFPEAISATANGVHLAGLSDHPITNQTFAGSNILFIRSYDFRGALVWTSEFSNSSEGIGVSIDLPGVYILTGSSLVAYNSLNGQELWSHRFSEPGVNHPYSVTADSTGIYVSGTFGPTAFPTGLLTKYNSNGGVIWNVTFGSPNGSGAGPSSLSAGSSGVYLSMGSFVMKYDSNGNRVWSFQAALGPSGAFVTPLGFLVAADQAGFYLAGATGGIRQSEGLVQSFSSSPSLVFFGLNPPFSFVLVGALIGVVVLSVFFIRRHYLRMMSRRSRSASPDRYRKPAIR